ncbi:MAG: cation-translocating P-type ATPase [Blastocatellia bacterium]
MTLEPPHNSIPAQIFFPEGHPYAKTEREVLAELGVEEEWGLGRDEVVRRQQQYGENRLPEARRRAAWRIWVGQFTNVVVGLLVGAAGIAWWRGGRGESVAILMVLWINAGIGFLTEWKAGRALEALRREVALRARVRREGREQVIEAWELVPGDIVMVGAGDKVPADARLLEEVGLGVEEASLTGESAPVAKGVEAVERETPMAERRSMLYLGTTIVAGRGVGVVTATGGQTELGRIGELVAETEEETTPLKQRLDELGARLVWLVLGIGGVVVIAGWWRGDGLWLMIETGISLAVAAVPEGLPAVTTLILALGVLRMSRARAVVRHLPAVEALGRTTVICADKTGTLTLNRMVVREYRLPMGPRVSVEGEQWREEVGDRSRLLERALEVGVLCSEASFHRQGDDPASLVGDPTETALLEVADRCGIEIGELRARQPKIEEEPFDAQTRRMVTVHELPEGMRRFCLKGAPSVVLPLCDRVAGGAGNLPWDEAAREEMDLASQEMGASALRVLALAEKIDPVTEGRQEDGGYTFLGLVGMIDPPRPEAAAAIAQARAAGIRVVMLTGDQLDTARAIARELGLGEGGDPRVRHAHELGTGEKPEISRVLGGIDVVARVSPEDKLRIVVAFQEAGEIVAVTGDGVNDTPALKRANIGIAMGARGTESAREVADIVLLDDNLSTIVQAVEGGRTIYANLLRFVQLLLSENLAEVLFIFASILLGWPLPLLPLQILWVNLVTDLFPALALAVEPPEADLMRQPPRDPEESILSRSFFFLISWQGAMLAGLCLMAYGWSLERYGPGDHARTVALMSLIGCQVGHLFNCRSRMRSALTGLFRNRWLWLSLLLVGLLQGVAIGYAPLAEMLGTVTLTLVDWWVVGATVFVPILVVEAIKWAGRPRRG